MFCRFGSDDEWRPVAATACFQRCGCLRLRVSKVGRCRCTCLQLRELADLEHDLGQGVLLGERFQGVRVVERLVLVRRMCLSFSSVEEEPLQLPGEFTLKVRPGAVRLELQGGELASRRVPRVPQLLAVHEQPMRSICASSWIAEARWLSHVGQRSSWSFSARRAESLRTADARAPTTFTASSTGTSSKPTHAPSLLAPAPVGRSRDADLAHGDFAEV